MHASPVIGRPCIMWAAHRSTHPFGRVSSSPSNEMMCSSPVIGRSCISCASHCFTYQFRIVSDVLGKESSHTSLVIGRAEQRIVRARHQCTHQVSRVVGALGNESVHASPVIGRSCTAWARYRPTNQCGIGGKSSHACPGRDWRSRSRIKRGGRRGGGAGLHVCPIRNGDRADGG